MFIEEVILDGFKSYATRTVIQGFDPSFNAITGLNGSGKSNILDAICFVLGITNLTQVRVKALQELVYKQGQAGVTKASATIVFNNEDKNQSPVGYEQYEKITVTRQVVIGGRNKYLINGHNALANRVQNLFHSVQLNVNNPHFLIMQGKIQEVINMKAPEILSMIEEAAGTRMFETKKQAALKTISKKDNKVEEIAKVLREEITPTLENLRKERTLYSKWTSTQDEVEKLTRFTVAYDYFKAKETLQTSGSDLKELENTSEELKKQSDKLSKMLEKTKNQIAKLLEKHQSEAAGALKQLESQSNKLSKEYVKLNSEWKHASENQEAEKKTFDRLKKQQKESSQALESRKKDLKDAESEMKAAQEKFSVANKEANDLEKQLEALSLGVSTAKDTNSSDTLTAKLMQAKRDLSIAATECKQIQMKIDHVEKELNAQRKLAKAKSAKDEEYAKLQQNLENCESNIKKLKEQIDNLHYSPSEEKDLLTLKQKIEAELGDVQEQVQKLEGQTSSLDFSYQPPSSAWDQGKVKGLVAKLFSVKKTSDTLALEVTAGAKLYQVITDSHRTAQLLIEKGKLKRRVTFIPLDKIQPKTTSSSVVKDAQSLVGFENARLALALVDFEPQLQPAFQYVFGNTFICSDTAAAKKVTFQKEIKTRSVTLEGDLFDPAGTLTGGSRTTTTGTLTLLASLSKLQAKQKELIGKLGEINDSITAAKQKSAKYIQMMQKLELETHQKNIIMQKLLQNQHHQSVENLNQLEEQYEQLKLSLTAAEKKKVELGEQCEDLESQIKNFENNRDSHLKQLEKRVTDAKAKASKISKDLKTKQNSYQQMTIEIGELEGELAKMAEELQTTNANLESLAAEVDAKAHQAAKKKQEYESAQEILEAKRNALMEDDQSISKLKAEMDEISQQLTDTNVESKKVEHKISRYHKDKKDAAKFVEHLESKHSWINSEKQFFGKPNTDFDFKAQDPQKAQKKLAELQEEQAKISKNINKKVMSMFEKAEQEYQQLMEKKRIIEADKSKIEAVIKELDEKKNDALKTTWQKVNKDFGSIFSTLLPGTTAKLEPPEGKTVLDGLEMKVAFGNVWKESLSELSGGQRSLLALSLILALLLFKPAPMYILDEIDAALDLNHTQNIGQMLKTHFSKSQFLIVSLKEDMFNNANVIFTTKFIDGVSTVTRTKGNSGEEKKGKKAKH